MTFAIHFAKMVLLTYTKSITASLQIFLHCQRLEPSMCKQCFTNFQLINHKILLFTP